MNTVLVMVLLILIIFALKEGQIWIALGLGILMVVLTVDTGGKSETSNKEFTYNPPAMDTPQRPKEQMLRVKYQPSWDGNNWWEEMPEHWGQGIGRMFGLIR